MRSIQFLMLSFALFMAGCATGPSVTEGLNRNQIQEPLDENVQSFVGCYADRLKSKPKLEGKIVVAFLIGKDGTVNDSRVVKSTMNDEITEQCVNRVVKTLEFPEPKGQVLVKVTYPFQFKRNKNFALK